MTSGRTGGYGQQYPALLVQTDDNPQMIHSEKIDVMEKKGPLMWAIKFKRPIHFGV